MSLRRGFRILDCLRFAALRNLACRGPEAGARVLLATLQARRELTMGDRVHKVTVLNLGAVVRGGRGVDDHWRAVGGKAASRLPNGFCSHNCCTIFSRSFCWRWVPIAAPRRGSCWIVSSPAHAFTRSICRWIGSLDRPWGGNRSAADRRPKGRRGLPIAPTDRPGNPDSRQ